MKILKLLVIEDDALLREALCGASREALRTEKREAIVFEAFDRSEATQIVKQHGHVDLIVLDLELPDTDTFEFLRELEALLFPDNLGTSSPFLPLDLTLSWYPTVSLVVVSERQGYDIFENGGSLENDARLKEVAQIMGEDYESGQILTPRGVLRRALDEGAVGFIPKSASREIMLDAFRSIFAGGHYIPWPPPPLDPCDGPVNPRPLRTPGTAQAVDAVNREAVVAARNAESVGSLEFTAISTLHRKIARLLAAQNAIDNLRPTTARKRRCERRDASLRQGDAMRRDFRNGSFTSFSQCPLCGQLRTKAPTSPLRWRPRVRLLRRVVECRLPGDALNGGGAHVKSQEAARLRLGDVRQV